MMRHDLGHAIGALKDIGISDDKEHAFLRTLHQPAGRFENGDAGTFRSHQSTRHVETVFREQVIQVVAGDAARNIGVAFSDEIGVCVAQPLKPE